MAKPLPLLLFAIVTITACTREDVNGPVITSTVSRLKEITIEDSIVAYTHKLNFYYDAADRANKMTFDSKTFYPAPQRYLQFFTDSFYYNGTDTLPWKIESTVAVPGEPAKHYTSFITYNTQGLKIKDSLIRDDGGSIYSTNRIYKQGTDYITDPLYQDSIVFENGNMKSAYRKNGASPFFTFLYDSVDNKINPYSVLNIAESYFKRYLYISDDWSDNARKYFQGHFNMQSRNKNNMVKWQLLNYSMGATPWSWYYFSQYTYDPGGYPLTQDLIVREGSETGPLYNRLRYTYTYY